jgi:hypothetical protein
VLAAAAGGSCHRGGRRLLLAALALVPALFLLLLRRCRLAHFLAALLQRLLTPLLGISRLLLLLLRFALLPQALWAGKGGQAVAEQMGGEQCWHAAHRAPHKEHPPGQRRIFATHIK